MNGPINFAEINRAALAAFPAVLARILPGGKRVGAEIDFVRDADDKVIALTLKQRGAVLKGERKPDVAGDH